MTDIRKRGISRRRFLKGVGGAAGALGLSKLSGGLMGCVPPQPPLLYGKELVGNVTASAADIRLVAGETCLPSTRFKLFYDTVSRSDPMSYAGQTGELTGFELHDPIPFGLGGLNANTRYYYRVAVDEGSGWTYRDEYSFHTQRPPGSSFRFCINTDAHISPLGVNPRNTNVARNILVDAPDLMLTLGDHYFLSYQGGLSFPFWTSREAAYDNWKRVRSVLDVTCQSMGYVHIIGNHDGESGWDSDLETFGYCREGRLDYLAVPDAGTHPEGGDPLGRYGAFTWGDALFVWLDVFGFCDVDPAVLDDNAYYVLGDQQLAFLEDTLANSSATWKFLFAHHLVGGDDSISWAQGYGRGGARAAHDHQQAVVQDLMVEHGAQAYFFGHDHAFTVGDADGVKYICAGHSSSCPWKDELPGLFGPDDAYPDVGHVRIDVTPTQATVAYIQSTGGAGNGDIVASHVLTP